MPDFSPLIKTLGKVPSGALNVIIILGAFGLAAFAIYAMLVVIKGRP